jgi:hypothetical protein
VLFYNFLRMAHVKHIIASRQNTDLSHWKIQYVIFLSILELVSGFKVTKLFLGQWYDFVNIFALKGENIFRHFDSKRTYLCILKKISDFFRRKRSKNRDHDRDLWNRLTEADWPWGRFFVHFFQGKFRGKFRRKFSP